MYCARCGASVDTDMHACPQCGADLSVGGGIRLTDPSGDLSANLRRYDIAKAHALAASPPDVDALISPTPIEAGDATEPTSAGSPTESVLRGGDLASAKPRMTRARDDDVSARSDATAPDGVPEAGRTAQPERVPKHVGRTRLIIQANESLGRAKEWVNDRLPDEVRAEIAEVRSNRRKRATVPFLIGVLLIALAVSVGLAWVLMSTPDRSAEKGRPSASASKSPSATPTPTPTPAPKPAPKPTPTPTPTPKPTLPDGSKTCGPGVGANDGASCPFALSVADEVNHAMSGSVDITAYSPTSKRSFKMSCSRESLITCATSGSARVYIIPSN